MSMFGDHTPRQDMLDALRYVKSEHKLTFVQFMHAILDVLACFAEYLSSDSDD
jgi:hypothetical protein